MTHRLLIGILLLLNPVLLRGDTLKVDPTVIDWGEIYVGQLKEARFTVKNEGTEVVELAKVVNGCGCMSTIVGSHTLLPGHATEVRTTVRRTEPGQFRLSSLIVPKDSTAHTPVKVQILGNARRLVSLSLGIQGRRMDIPDGRRVITDLGMIPRTSATMTLDVTSLDERHAVTTSVVDVNSTYFKSVKQTPVRPDGTENTPEKLVITLLPKTPLAVGPLRDNVTLTFPGGVRESVDLVAEIYGNVYGSTRLLHMGRLERCGSKPFSLHFANGIKPWTHVKWQLTGPISEVIKVRRRDGMDTASSLALELLPDPLELKDLHQGYLHGQAVFYEHSGEDADVVVVTMTGFHSQEAEAGATTNDPSR